MTELQKAIAAKMLTEILEEKDTIVRANRVEEYRNFMSAVSYASAG